MTRVSNLLTLTAVNSLFCSVCRTALMLASLGRHTDCVHILLEKGANADAADKKGFTALHRAVGVFAVCVCSVIYITILLFLASVTLQMFFILLHYILCCPSLGHVKQ